MHTIQIYSKAWCPYCNKAKSLLRSKGLDYQEIDITHDLDRELETKLRGFFAAGAVNDGRDKQVVIAAAEEAKAAPGPSTAWSTKHRRAQS